MRKPLALAVAASLLSLAPGTLLAQSTPQAIKVQGFLSQNSGGTKMPVNGPVMMSFALYDADVGGTLISTVGPMTVDVTNGLYEVDLPFLVTDFSGPSRFLEVAVNGQILAPRLRLDSAPFAYTAETLDGFDSTAFARPTDITNAIVAHVAQADPHPQYLQKAGDVMSGTLTLNPSSGNALITSSGNVGIGTAAPQGLLQINTPSSVKNLVFSRTGLSSQFQIRVSNNGVADTLLISNAASDAQGFTIQGDGKVGVGMSVPGTQLDVAGIIRGHAVTSGSDAVEAINTLGHRVANMGNHQFDHGILQAFQSDGVTETVRLSGSPGSPMWLKNGGNVGIGTTTPTAPLTVVGLIQSDSLTVNGNVAIGTSAPASKLTVAGIIQSTTGGIKFPDGTTQTSAASAVQYFVTCVNGGVTSTSCLNETCTCGPGGTLVSINPTSNSIPGTCTVAVPTDPSITCQASSVTGGNCFGFGLGSCCLCKV